MDGSWLDEDHHDFLEELKMEILEEQKKEANWVSMTILAKSSLAPSLYVLTCIKGLYLFMFSSQKDTRKPPQVQIQQHVPLPFWRRTVV